MKKRRFIRNAAVMTATTLLLRAIGMAFRIYISNRIGAQGMGLYQLIVSVYVLASSFASSGLTTAVTRLCTDRLAAGHHRSSTHALHIGIGIGCTIGVISAALICLTAPWIADSGLHDYRAVPSLYALSFSLPFMGISCCIKGYFLAKRKVNASSLSQIIEQVVRIGAIVVLLKQDAFQGTAMSCCAILIGDTIAEAVSCGYIVLVYAASANKSALRSAEEVPAGTARQLLTIAAPITAGRYINSGLRTIENSAVPTNLALFCGSREAALADFGKLKGMAMPLIFFPSSFLNAFSALLIPEVSEANALGHTKQVCRTVEKSISITLLSAHLIGGIFWVIAAPLSELVYGDVSIGMYIRFLAPLTPVMYVESVAVGLLKGLNQQTPSLIYGIIDSITRILLIYTLLPAFGMSGMMVLMVFSNLLTCALHMHRLMKAGHGRFLWKKWLLKPLFAVGTAIGLTQTLLNTAAAKHWDTVWICAVGVILMSVVYILLLSVTKGITAEDLTMVRRLPPKSALT